MLTGLAAFNPRGGPGQPGGFSPAQISQAYGFNRITFNDGTVQGDGTGQTIAIVDAYSQPDISSDLQTFDATYGLPAPPNFTVVNQNGGTSLPAADQGWGLEISLDVEWAHAMAPKANILLVEADSNSYLNLMTAVNYARNQPNVSVVSMSWGGGEWTSESYYDSYFTTPSGHKGVSFVASSGDSGSSGAPEFPSVSPNVLAVGGTQLTTDAAGNYQSEVGWSGSGGGLSTVEGQPGYQRGVVTQSSTLRAVPDVSYNGSNNSPFAVYDTTSYGGWIQVYGTSAGAPQWAALIAIANQGRQLAGKGTLDGATQTLPTLYQLPQSDFHDITSGSNGAYSAGPGYDLVTGRGSPFADRVVAGLVSAGGQSSNGPWIVSPATANPTPVTGTTTNLSVRGGDNAGASTLSYTWSVLSQPGSAATPTFRVNGTNAAQDTTVTFYAAGTYTFQATIIDASGQTASSDVTVIVGQTQTSVLVTPTSTTVADGSVVHFAAMMLDQFGRAMGVQPAWNWTLIGAGTLDSNGVYTAPPTGAGTISVQATGGGLTGSATLAFLPPLPSPVVGTSADAWMSWLSVVDQWMAELVLLESFWESLLTSWPR
jgi:subtilase family serine protease